MRYSDARWVTTRRLQLRTCRLDERIHMNPVVSVLHCQSTAGLVSKQGSVGAPMGIAPPVSGRAGNLVAVLFACSEGPKRPGPNDRTPKSRQMVGNPHIWPRNGTHPYMSRMVVSETI